MIWKRDIGNFLHQLYLRSGFNGNCVNYKINYRKIFLEKKVEIIQTTYLLNLMRVFKITVNHISTTVSIYNFYIS